jgi:small nuclear ribonucleoprotein F
MWCNSVNEEVIIRLKWGQTEYKGRLVSIDSYMNIQLSGAEEWIDQKMTSVLGQVLIRCVLHFRDFYRWRDELIDGYNGDG